MTAPRATLRTIAGSALFYAGLVLLTLVYAPLVIVAILAPYRARYALVEQWTRLNLAWLGVACGLHHVVEGLDRIPESPCVVLAKHQSAYETLALVHYFRPQVWVLKQELLRLPVFGQALASLRPIAIDRAAGKSAMDQVLEQGAARLDAGCWVMVFPEGTRVAPGARRRYKLGGATLAARTGHAALPVAHNAGDFWPRNSFLKYPGTIRFVIGEPIATEGLAPSEVNARAEAWIEATVEALRAPYADGAPATAPESRPL